MDDTLKMHIFLFVLIGKMDATAGAYVKMNKKKSQKPQI